MAHLGRVTQTPETRRPPISRLWDGAGGLQWHRDHENATLYSVLSAASAWRFAAENVLGPKLEGAAWARDRWPDRATIDAAVELDIGASPSSILVRSVEAGGTPARDLGYQLEIPSHPIP